MGELLALGAALCYSTMSVMVRKAQAGADTFVVTLYSLLVNVILFGAWWGFLLWRDKAPVFLPAAVGLFFVAGIFGSAIGRSSTFLGIHYLGPSRNTAMKGSLPLFTLFLALIFLGQKLSALDTVGLLLIVGGLFCLALESPMGIRPFQGASGPVSIPAPDGRDAAAAVSAVGIPGVRETPSAGTGRGSAISRRAWTIGAAASITASFSQAAATIIRKAGLNEVDSPLLGAMVGTWAGVLAYLVVFSMQGRWTEVRRIPRSSLLYSTAAGVANSMGLILAFSSYMFTDVAVSEALIATQPLLAIVLSFLLLGKLERITPPVVGSAVLMVAGAAVLVLI